MKLMMAGVIFELALVAASGWAQQVIPLYPEAPAASAASSHEKEYFSKIWNTEVVTNVTNPTLTLFRPAAGTANGSAIVICPGGGFMALSIENEGIAVAKRLTQRGMTAFVLKYRLAHTGEDATQEFMTMFADQAKFKALLGKTVPLSIADGLAAVQYVRAHAGDWGVDPSRVGIIGFSAGGTVAAATGLQYKTDGRPAFVAPIYAGTELLMDAVPADAPPLFVAAASDDQLGLTMDSVDFYDRWQAAHRSAEMHIYAKGGHGFGMRKQGLPSDEWIDRFLDWLVMQGWVKQ